MGKHKQTRYFCYFCVSSLDRAIHVWSMKQLLLPRKGYKTGSETGSMINSALLTQHVFKNDCKLIACFAFKLALRSRYLTLFWDTLGPHSPLLRDVFNFVKFKSGKRSPLQGGHFKRVLKIDLLLILALSKLEFANEWGERCPSLASK